MMWYWGGGAVQWWGWLLGSVAMVAFWGLLIWAVWYFVTGVARRPHEPYQPPSREPGDAKRILDQRLARGEIDADEYRRLLDVIRGDSVHAGNGQTPTATGR